MIYFHTYISQLKQIHIIFPHFDSTRRLKHCVRAHHGVFSNWSSTCVICAKQGACYLIILSFLHYAPPFLGRHHCSRLPFHPLFLLLVSSTHLLYPFRLMSMSRTTVALHVSSSPSLLSQHSKTFRIPSTTTFHHHFWSYPIQIPSNLQPLPCLLNTATLNSTHTGEASLSCSGIAPPPPTIPLRTFPLSRLTIHRLDWNIVCY